MKKAIPYFGTALLLACLFFNCGKNKPSEELFEKAEKNAGKWCFIPMADMTCRNGSSTGLGVRLNPDSDKVLIYLEGGGGCFNSLTCLANPTSFKRSSFAALKYTTLQLGIFNDNNEENPFKDWNIVYVPYCTGDVHSGTNANASVTPTITGQNMVGSNNMNIVLAELNNYFAQDPVSEIFLTGSSAGGFGTLACANQVIEAFAGTKITVLDDSGPILTTQEAQPDCLDHAWQEIFGFHIPDDFATYTTGQQPTDIKSIYEYLGNKHPNVRFGIISSLHDFVIREFYGYGKNNCETSEIVSPISGEAYENGLEHVRDSVLMPFQNWNTFYTSGDWHVFNILNSTINTLEVDNIRFATWLDSLRNGEQAWHVYEQ